MHSLEKEYKLHYYLIGLAYAYITTYNIIRYPAWL